MCVHITSRSTVRERESIGKQHSPPPPPPTAETSGRVQARSVRILRRAPEPLQPPRRRCLPVAAAEEEPVLGKSSKQHPPAKPTLESIHPTLHIMLLFSRQSALVTEIGFWGIGFRAMFLFSQQSAFISRLMPSLFRFPDFQPASPSLNPVPIPSTLNPQP